MPETKVAIAEDLILDFSGLFTGEPPEKEAPESPVEPFLGAGQYKTLTETESPGKGQINGLKTMLEKKSEQPKKIKAENKTETKTNKESE